MRRNALRLSRPTFLPTPVHHKRKIVETNARKLPERKIL